MKSSMTISVAAATMTLGLMAPEAGDPETGPEDGHPGRNRERPSDGHRA